jgi:hypothetical protein
VITTSTGLDLEGRRQPLLLSGIAGVVKEITLDFDFVGRPSGLQRSTAPFTRLPVQANASTPAASSVECWTLGRVGAEHRIQHTIRERPVKIAEVPHHACVLGPPEIFRNLPICPPKRLKCPSMQRRAGPQSRTIHRLGRHLTPRSSMFRKIIRRVILLFSRRNRQMKPKSGYMALTWMKP